MCHATRGQSTCDRSTTPTSIPRRGFCVSNETIMTLFTEPLRPGWPLVECPRPSARRRRPARLRGLGMTNYRGKLIAETRVELTELERLDAHHDVVTFDAGPTDTGGQGPWLRDHGLANDRKGLTRTFVASYAGTARVAAFFGLTSGAIERVSLPRRFRPHGTPSAIPAWLIARLAVDYAAGPRYRPRPEAGGLEPSAPGTRAWRRSTRRRGRRG